MPGRTVPGSMLAGEKRCELEEKEGYRYFMAFPHLATVITGSRTWLRRGLFPARQLQGEPG